MILVRPRRFAASFTARTRPRLIRPIDAVDFYNRRRTASGCVFWGAIRRLLPKLCGRREQNDVGGKKI